MATLVAPGIHQFKVPLPNQWLPYVLVYCFEGDDGYTLIDCGWNTEEAWTALTEQMTEIGADVKDVAHLIVTHIHPDHYGLAGRLRDETGCEVVLHEREQTMVEARYKNPERLLETMRVWLKGQGVPDAAVEDMHSASMPVRRFVTAVEPDTRLKGDEYIRIGNYVLQAIWTPGHSAGHVCLVEREADFMLTGDHVLPRISPNVSLHPQQAGNPLADYFESLEKVKNFNVTRGFAAHEYIIEDLPKRIDELEEHHRERLGEMVTAIAGGAETSWDVARAVAWAVGSFDDFSIWQKRAALTETVAHLEYARTRNMLAATEKNGVVVYSRHD